MAIPYRQRTRQFTVYLNEEEMAILEAKKDEAGMTKSTFIRHMIRFGTAHEITVFSQADSAGLMYELNRIGNNLNQIAYWSNAKHSVNEGDFLALYDNYKQLLGTYDSFIRGHLDECRA